MKKPPFRRILREKVFKALFAWFFTQDKPQEAFFKALHDDHQKLLSNQRDDEAIFIHELFFGVTRNLQPFLDTIAAQLEHWDIKRVTPVDKTLMLMALCEFKYFPNIPTQVTISEYLHLAATFGTEHSPQFINGILEKIKNQWTGQNLIIKNTPPVM